MEAVGRLSLGEGCQGCQGRGPEFNSQHPHGGREELTPESRPEDSTAPSAGAHAKIVKVNLKKEDEHFAFSFLHHISKSLSISKCV